MYTVLFLNLFTIIFKYYKSFKNDTVTGYQLSDANMSCFISNTAVEQKKTLHKVNTYFNFPLRSFLNTYIKAIESVSLGCAIGEILQGLNDKVTGYQLSDANMSCFISNTDVEQ